MLVLVFGWWWTLNPTVLGVPATRPDRGDPMRGRVDLFRVLSRGGVLPAGAC